MKNISQKITAFLFLAMLFGMFVLLLCNHDKLKTEILYQYRNSTTNESNAFQRINAAIDATENQLDQSNPLRTALVNLNGGFQRLIGKRVIEDADPMLKVHRLEDGRLTFTVEPTETDWKAENLAELSEWCASRNTPLLYVQAPFKIDPDDPQLPVGTSDYTNQNADHLLNALKQYGVDHLDLRREIKKQGLDHASLFYKTDSHWTTEAAFWAYTTICDVLEKKYGFAIDDAVTDLNQFTKTTYEDIFLGSQGKRVGTLYSGVDDLDVLLPDFETNIRYEVPNHGFYKEGAFEQTVMDYAHVETTDYYNKSPYYVYSGGDYPLSHFKNLNQPDGKKVLLVRDSFSCAVAPLLSLAVGQVDTFDLRYNDSSLKEYIDVSKPDIVVFLFNPGVLRDDAMFEY